MMGETFLSVLSLLLLNAFFYCGHAQDAMLTLQPNLSHFFAGESVTFTCDMGESNATDWLYKFIWNDQQIAPFSNNNSHSCYMMTNMSGDYQCTGLHKGSVNIIKESNTINLSVSVALGVNVRRDWRRIMAASSRWMPLNFPQGLIKYNKSKIPSLILKCSYNYSMSRAAENTLEGE
ncbi:uncharacterized protein KZ484_004549 isoform 1-T1 [Pholidichthys leucotaenia]